MSARIDAPTKARSLTVPMLARVEGEGGFSVRVKDGKVQKAELKIFEPPRLFEGFLRGRAYTEPPDVTARICGICPVAYQMSAAHALEAACGVTVGGPLRELRRLLYCGEWIESHVLHIALLQAPDLLGYASGLAMAKDHADLVNLALRLKKAGNTLMTVIGGREIHPVSVRVGGFWKVPLKRDLAPVAEELKWCEEAARKLLAAVAALPVPDHTVPHALVALRHPDEYPLCEGRLVSDRGLDIPAADYEKTFAEEHVKRSNALHSRHEGDDTFLVGPIARYSLNFDRLDSESQAAARAAGLGPVCRNPFQGIVVRGVETLWAIREAARIIAAWEPPPAPAVPVRPRAGTGCAITEAPRGILYHRYTLDAHGAIVDVKIVPPTAQNLRAMERDLVDVVEESLEMTDERLTLRCEETLRNYDPCISCATHFLKLDIRRE